MSSSQAGTGPTNIDAAIKLAVFEDNWIQGRYDIEHLHFQGPSTAGMRVFTRQRALRSRVWKPVALLITDWVSSSDPVTIASGQTLTANQGTAGAAAWPVSQNLLAAFDNPDVTVNQSGSLKTSEQVRLGATDQPDITVNQSAAGGLKTTPAARTRVDGQTFAITSLAGASAEATKATGATTLTPGNSVYFMLGVSGGTTLTTPADDAVYVALKGATSAAYYAVAYFGETIAGVFAGVNSEKMNIVARNQDTVAHTMNGTYLATSY